MEYYVGDGSSYDVDMQLIQSFIRAKNEPENILAQTSVFTYYISQLYNYWNYFKENINKSYGGRVETETGWYVSSNLHKSLDLYNKIPGYQGNFIEDHIYEYEERLMELIRIAQDNFTETYKLDMGQIINLFKYVGSLMCVQPYA